MSTAPTLFARFLAVLLGIISVSACQRASYSFSTTGAAAVPAGPAVPVATVRLPRYAPILASLSPQGRRAGEYHPKGGWSWPGPKVAGLHQSPAVAGPIAGVAAAHVQRVAPAAISANLPVRQRSRTVAIILAVLAVSYVPLSLHNFYLGYYERGAAAVGLLILGSYLLLVGTVGFLAPSSSLTVIGYLGLAMLAGWFGWQLNDLFRIIRRDLKPRNGEYASSASPKQAVLGA